MPVIKEFNEKVSRFLGDKKLGNPQYPIFLGVEFEYEVKTPSGLMDRSTARNHREAVGISINSAVSDFAILKHDGSLANGFEVVSLPMSLKEHQKRWDKLFESGRKNGLLTPTNCGLHVHVSRELLTPLQIGKVLLFVYSPENQSFIRKIAGRIPPKRYSELSPKKITDTNHHRNRYSAVNLTNSETIEFRFFKSTLRKPIALRCIEFCEALIKFTWASKYGVSELKKDSLRLFCEYVNSDKSEYPNLHLFLVKSGYIKEIKK